MPLASLPDDVVLIIIDTCDHLEKDRAETLAALCRLAKRYREAAECALYSRVELKVYEWPLKPGDPRMAMHTLVDEPRLRAYVNSVRLDIADRYARDPRIVGILRDLENVQEVSLLHPGLAAQAVDQLLAPGNIRIRSFECGESLGDAAGLLQRRATAFSTLDRLQLVFLVDLEHLDLSGFRTLERLLLFGEKGFIELFRRVVPHIMAILSKTVSLPYFVSLAIEGTFYVYAVARHPFEPFIPATPSQVPPESKEILAAIPPQIQHLSLNTNGFLADDVATYVLGPSRPRSLRTLRLGGAVSKGFKEFARTKRAWYADFERTMEEAGVVLMTVE